jgi:hypothetical protein
VMEVPSEWRPLSFANQTGTPVIWFEAELTAPLVQKVVFLVFTGESVPENAKYIGTATFGANGFIVVHCYVR